MSITVNTKNTLDALLKKAGDMSKAVNRALIVNAMQFSDDIKQTITAKKSKGKTYYNWGQGYKGRKNGVRRGKPHIASSPGNPPNGDTGFLAFSTSPSKKVENNTVFVIVSAKYARTLEFKRNRPFVKPARNKFEPIFRERIIAAINAT